MLERGGGAYANTAATDLFLDKNKQAYVGGLLEMANARLYSFWGSLTEALRQAGRRTRSSTAAIFSRASTLTPIGSPASLRQ